MTVRKSKKIVQRKKKWFSVVDHMNERSLICFPVLPTSTKTASQDLFCDCCGLDIKKGQEYISKSTQLTDFIPVIPLRSRRFWFWNFINQHHLNTFIERVDTIYEQKFLSEKNFKKIGQ